jgi:hypothetical protein
LAIQLPKSILGIDVKKEICIQQVAQQIILQLHLTPDF